MTPKKVVGMLVFLLLCLATMWALRSTTPKEEPGPSTLLQPFDRAAVTKLVVIRGDEELMVRRRQDDSQLFDQRVGADFVRADSIAMDELLGQLQRSPVHRSFKASETSAAQIDEWGLTEPVLEVRLSLLGGDERMARYGARSGEGEKAYADRGEGTDPMVVDAEPIFQLTQALDKGLRDRRLTDLRTYDVKRIEIVRGGVTALEAWKDVSQIWHVGQPYVGYAQPQQFETALSRIVNEQWITVTEDGAQVLAPYGLDPPAAVIELSRDRESEEPDRVVLLGRVVPDSENGDRYAMERGSRSVVVVSGLFAEAALIDPAEIRDRSFTRIGRGGNGLVVKLGDTSYRLAKTHTDWDLEEPFREKLDGAAVERLFESLRGWHTYEFLDGESPADYGIADDGDQIVVQREGGSSVKFLIGKEASADRNYAQRAGDGGVEIVDRAPLDLLRAGIRPLKRDVAREWAIEDLDRFERIKGFAPEADGIQDVAVKREVEPGAPAGPWENDGPNYTGGLDAAAVTRVMKALYSVRVLEWLDWDATKNEEMGFRPGEPTRGATLTIVADFAERAGTLPLGNTQRLVIGHRREGGGYYARYDDHLSDWAFLLSDDLVETLRTHFFPEGD